MRANGSQSIQRLFTATAFQLGTLLLVSILTSSPVRGEAGSAFSAEAVASAIAALDKNDLDGSWHFTMRIEQDDTQQVVVSDPGRPPPERRQLVTVNGQAPTIAEVADFHAAEAKRIEEQGAQTQAFTQLVNLETLNFLGVEGDIVEYAFIPRIPKLEKASENLRGTLRIDTGSRSVTAMEIFNTEAFSPAFSVSIENYRLSFDFAMQQGVNLLSRMQNHARGKAAFVKEFDSTTTIIFAGFRKASL